MYTGYDYVRVCTIKKNNIDLLPFQQMFRQITVMQRRYSCTYEVWHTPHVPSQRNAMSTQL